MTEKLTAGGKTVAEMANMYARAARVWLPGGSPTDFERFVRDGGCRGAIVKVGGLMETLTTNEPLSPEKIAAKANIIEIEHLGLDTPIRQAVDDATLAVLTAEDVRD